MVLQKVENAIQIDNKTSTIRKEKITETQKVDSTLTKANLIMKENVEEGRVKKDVYMYLIKKLGIPLVLKIFWWNIIYQFFSFFTRLWLMIWVNANDRLDLNNNQTFYLLIFGGLGLMGGLTSFLTHILVMNGVYRVSKIMYNELVRAVLHWPLWLLDATPVGRIINRLTTDTYVLDDVAGKRFVGVLESACKHLIIMALVIYIAPITVIVFVFVFVILFGAQKSFAKLEAQLQRINANNKSPMSSFMIETLQGLHSIRANGYSKLFTSQCYDKIDLYNSGAKALEISQRWFSLRATLLSGTTVSISTFFILLESNSSNLSFTCLSLSYVLQSLTELSWLFLYFLDLETAVINVERIKKFIDSPQEQYKSSSESKIVDNWPRYGKIEFINYKLRYRKQNELVLKGLTFTVGNGEKVGIVGRTGAGKSSVIIGLLRMVEPDSGKILIDEVDVTQIDLKILRSHLTLIPQDPILFQGTLRFNLDPDSKYSDENLWNALEKSHLKDYILQLPQRLEHPIEEGGENLSCGQRQLVCLARALLRKTKILLLDEATASVDLETDELIQNTIRKEFANCTVLTIAHRLNTIQDYEKILVLDDGNVIEYDSPNNLIQSKNSRFYDIMRESGLV